MTSQAKKVELPAATAGLGPFDAAHLERATFGDDALARELLVLFERQADKLLEEISAAPDSRTRRNAAHTLKGAAKGVGAFAIARAAEEIETAGDDPVEVIGALACLSVRVVQAKFILADVLARN